MTPFESLPILADEWVALQADRATAQQRRDGFFASTIAQMQGYANGQGDIPAIVKRSGKSTMDGIKFGRSEMSYFLGIAFMEGATAGRDATQAVKWLERASAMGNRGAQAKLGAFRQ
jgi:TPR repeat protein